MNKEQGELCGKAYDDSIYKNQSHSFFSGWQACLDANKDKMIDTRWPEWAKQRVEFLIPNIFVTIEKLKECLRNDEWTEETISSAKLIPRPVEKWQPKEGEWRWAYFKSSKEFILSTSNYRDCFQAKFNPENFDTESKMTESDFRTRGDFMEAGE